MTRYVYIVDDDRSALASVHSLMSLRPDQVVRGFPSGDRFLAEAASLQSGALLLDHHMPGATGLDVLDALGLYYPGKFAAIFLTGAPSVDLAVRALRAGALDFIEKPYEALVLFDAIDAAFSSLGRDGSAVARRAAARTRIDGLSARERRILQSLIEGCANKVIANALDISSRTVEICRASLMTKLSVGTLSAALRVAHSAGMISRI
ncbi:MAG: fixJ [Sphingomonas bacterium]|uniref:response regulator transcription factor n=1 Tax=Sphingomonas bacterium TaxID=1895847 RepID=UPI00262E8236|nr:response regulator [Sphingomonas bacterium]MDB5710794.1 fixJ [Sphingomonas bacterium]